MSFNLKTAKPAEIEELYQKALDAATLASKDIPDTGACGFGWVVIRPARGKFVNYLKKIEVGDKHCYGGWSIWSKYKGQSVVGNEAWANAFAKVLRDHGLEAYAQSRLD